MQEETAGAFLQRVGIDGKLWAAEMHKRFPQITEDDLLGWCCNMIMAGFDEATRRARKKALSEDDAVRLMEKVRSEYITNKRAMGLQVYDYTDAMRSAVIALRTAEAT